MLFDKDRNGHRIDPQDIHPNLVFCEVDCRHKVTELISSAKESIIIQNQYVEDEEII
jgi:phosphatidylserine/phosphatidylglycerophosphate/cardiolipin synthase-like enzyme